MKIKIIRNKVT